MPSRRPMTLTRMFCSMISDRSPIMYCSSNCMRKAISSAGRFQFSLERQYSVSCSNAQPGTLFGDAADDARAAAVAFDPRQPLAVGPAAVAVHDDGDVPRHLLGRHVGQHELLRPGRHGVLACACASSGRRGRAGFDTRSAHQALWTSLAKIVCCRSGPTETTSTGRPTSTLSRSR